MSGGTGGVAPMIGATTDEARRVLVTAGASGIGRVIAEAFAATGARVWVTDIDETALAARGIVIFWAHARTRGPENSGQIYI